MGVVSVSSSASRMTTLAVRRGLSASRSQALRRSSISFVAFKSPDRDVVKTLPKYGKQFKRAEIVTVEATAAVPSAAEDLDYNEVAEVLENIYKLSPAEVSDVEQEEQRGRSGKRRKRGEREQLDGVVRNRKRRTRRLSLDLRIELRRRRWREGGADFGEDVCWKGETGREKEAAEVFKLLREYSTPRDLVSLDWKKMKIPRVLSLDEHKLLFKMMQPMRAINEVKKNLHEDLNREPLDDELAKAVNLSVTKLKKYMEVGRAARNKIIKHNLRLVLYAIKKHYHEIANSQRFNDLCQAGAKGLVTAIDRFKPKHSIRLSTYALFWIRHSIVRSLTHSSLTRVSYGIEQVRQEIQKAKLELTFQHQRPPTVEEIIASVGISSERFHDVMKASTAVYSLNTRDAVTQEELVDCIRDVNGVDRDATPKRPALRRLAIDDVLDSLKPKESLVIRQRYGLDGKGERTLGEIAGNLSISREMVRKHERKALMKLKHPARLDYLRPYI